MAFVSKFGGSSLSCGSQFEKVKKIILAKEDRKVVVVSALGKRNSGDTKITDLLYILHAHLKYSVPYEDIWSLFSSRFIAVKNELNIEYSIEKDLDLLLKELNKNISQDYLVSRGEYLTAKLMASYIGYTFVDARDVITFSYDGKIDDAETSEKVMAAFKKYGKIVVPGFYGAYPNQSIKLFSRGGSDVSGAILAKAISAEMYENWTDVSGVLAADPRIVKNPRPIPEITYSELRELSYMGANVLHEETVFPVQESNIPINILNTNEPTNSGTVIKEDCDISDHIITGVAGKKDFRSYTIFKHHMSNEVGFLKRALEIFEKYNISIEHVPSGIDSFSIVVSKSQVEKCEFELVSELKQKLGASVSIDQDMALVAIVGRNMAKKSGICASVFNILGEEKINIKMLAQDPAELSIIIGIDPADYEKSIVSLYENLIK